MTIGIVAVAVCAARTPGPKPVTITSTFSRTQFGREVSEPLGFSFRIAALNDEVLTLEITSLAEFTQETLPGRPGRQRPRGRRCPEVANPVDLPRLLRLGDERRGEEGQGSSNKRAPARH
jgi:hypothetical protein